MYTISKLAAPLRFDVKKNSYREIAAGEFLIICPNGSPMFDAKGVPMAYPLRRVAQAAIDSLNMENPKVFYVIADETGVSAYDTSMSSRKIVCPPQEYYGPTLNMLADLRKRNPEKVYSFLRVCNGMYTHASEAV